MVDKTGDLPPRPPLAPQPVVASVFAPASQAATFDQALASYIDHTLLAPDATTADIERLCEEACTWSFHAVCVNSRFVAHAARLLKGSGVAVCSVIGFPLGAASTQAKLAEAIVACEEGARELDMVMPLGAAKAADWEAVAQDIATLALVTQKTVLLKVIIECCLLTEAEKIEASRVAVQAGADFIKTSTGFSTGGATLADVRLLSQTVGPDCGVKASGGIATRADALAMIEAGATRIGTSKGVALVGAAQACQSRL